MGPAAAAAAAKLLQLCLTLCDPIDGSPGDEQKGLVLDNCQPSCMIPAWSRA